MYRRTLSQLALAITPFVASCNNPTAADTVGPTVTATEPADGELGVPQSATIAATFSEPIAPASVTAITFTVASGDGDEPIVGEIEVIGDMATFTPGAPLAFATTYTVRLTTLIMDVGGNPLAEPFEWSFTTVGPPFP